MGPPMMSRGISMAAVGHEARLKMHDVLSVLDDLLADSEVGLCIEILSALRDWQSMWDTPVDANPADFRQMLEEAGLMKQGDRWRRRSGLKELATDAVAGGREAHCGPHLGGEAFVPGSPSECRSEQSPSIPVSPARAPKPPKPVSRFRTYDIRGLSPRVQPWVPDDRHGGYLARWFVLFTSPSQSILGRVVEAALVSTIALNTVALLLESMPEYRDRPERCAELYAQGLPLTVEACEPQPRAIFSVFEVICVTIFTFEYLARVLTVHAVSERPLWDTLLYARQPLNAIDLLAVLPYYCALPIKGSNRSAKSIVSVFRLGRILRLFKVTKYLPETKVFMDTMIMSGQPLAILLCFNLMLVVVFASLIYSAEGRRFSVALEFTAPTTEADCPNSTAPALYPAGVFVRKDAGGVEDTISPFRSIPYSMWWVCTTITTIGYGDFAPTTAWGKAIAVMCFYVGVIFLAMPITVLGANFQISYRRRFQEDATMDDRRVPIVRRRTSFDDMKDNYKKALRTQATMRPASTLSWLPTKTGVGRTVFAVLEEPSSCILGNVYSIFMLVAILLSTTTFVLESMPQFQETKEQCKVEMTVENCMPRPVGTFEYIEWVCILIFSADYVFRVATAHTAKDVLAEGEKRANASSLRVTLRYASSFLNLVDLVAIIPFYVELVAQSGNNGLAVLRVLRLVRTLRVLKMPKLRLGVMMLMNVVVDCMPALVLLITMSMLTCILFSACIVYAEGTSYSVDHFTEDFPLGLYIRPTKEGLDVEPSPFRSIPYAFWWFFATVTTVGYGDDYPTTTFGRIVALFCFYTGIILLALPVTIIGDKFTVYYPDWARAMGQELDEEFEEVAANPFGRHKRASRRASQKRVKTLPTAAGLSNSAHRNSVDSSAELALEPLSLPNPSREGVAVGDPGQQEEAPVECHAERDATGITLSMLKDGSAEGARTVLPLGKVESQPPSCETRMAWS